MKNIIIDEINNSIIYNDINGKQKLKTFSEFKTKDVAICNCNVVIIKKDNTVINYQLAYYDLCDIVRQ